MMFCLNLPPDIQHLPENTFFAGITPPPKEPTMVTITALSDPIVEQLRPLWEGRIFKTHRHQRGTKKCVGVLARIGDLLAMRKALGFSGVTSNNFCSFCLTKYEDMDSLHWKHRDGTQVLAAAKEWKNATTKKRRDQIYREHGVRWSSLHALPYGDPVKHTLLGLMHNWLEGVLQHHARVLWGIGVEASKNQEDSEEEIIEINDEYITDIDLATSQLLLPFPLTEIKDDLDAEIQDLYEEGQTYLDTPSHKARVDFEIAEAFQVLQFDDDDSYDDSDMDEDIDFRPSPDRDLVGMNSGSFTFSDEELHQIHIGLSQIVIPSWIERPPTNLGEKSHGKLKADQWLTLFSVFLPLILPELWSLSDSHRNTALLDNFHDLVSATNIVCSYTVTPDMPSAYLQHYISYRKSSQVLFPNGGSRPNHHFAMHNGKLMKFWGPLIQLSEFQGERHNGMLQKIKTNNHLCEFKFHMVEIFYGGANMAKGAMLRQICRRGRLMGFLRNPTFGSAQDQVHLASIADTLINNPNEKNDPSGLGLKIIPSYVYDAILAYVNGKGPIQLFRHYGWLPHPMNANVLPQRAIPIHYFKHNSRDYSTFHHHPGNSSVQFQPERDGVNSGQIESAWRFNLCDGDSRTFIVLSKHQPLPHEFQQTPYALRPGFRAKVVLARKPDELNLLIIEADNLEGHVAYYDRPAGTFGLPIPTKVVISSLDRDRT